MTHVNDVPCIPVIVGPTAVGKTAIAEALAAICDVTVISADSRQIYRRLDIGTGKPGESLLARVPHRGLDLVNPGERFSAGEFARAVPDWIEACGDRRQAVVVGGTGFYIKAITDGLFEEPPVDEERRRLLRQWTAKFGDPVRWAGRLDPDLQRSGRGRAVRAVEVALLTGYPLSWWHRTRPGRGVLRPWFVRVSLPRSVLHDRIRTRVDAMLSAGWVDEVRSILASGVDKDATGLDAVGYREIVLHLGGFLGADELAERIARATRRYAKRQETWFNHQLGNHPLMHVDGTQSPRRNAHRIAEAWRERST